jgi:nucleoside-diphosphate-sugar epimerase
MKILVTGGAGFTGSEDRILAERQRAVHESLADMREFPVGWTTSARAPSSTYCTTSGAEPV